MQKSSYNFPVEFIANPFGDTDDLAKLIAGGRILIVADMNVVQRVSGIGTQIGRYVQTRGLSLAGAPVVVAGGEKCKSDAFESFKRIVDAALDAKIGRNDVILALGGGALLDVAGYAAAQLRGGVRLVRMPTTPAAMMDAAFALSAALDFNIIKDALKVPCVPSAVVIDPAFATSVMDGVWNAGYSEVLRLAVVQDAPLFRKMLKLISGYCDHRPEALTEIVRTVCASRHKKGDSDFALWSALRLESMSDYRLPHGYAVAIGILIDSVYAAEKGLLKSADLEAIVSALRTSGSLEGLTHSRHLLTQVESLLRGLDAKELSTGEGSVTLPTGIGKSTVAEVDRDAMRKVIANYDFAAMVG